MFSSLQQMSFAPNFVIASLHPISLLPSRDDDDAGKSLLLYGARLTFVRVLLHLISLARREQVREGLALRDVVGILFQTFPEQFHRSGAWIRSRVYRRATARW